MMERMEQFKRLSQYVILNGMFALLAYLGYGYDPANATAATIFLVAINAINAFMILMCVLLVWLRNNERFRERITVTNNNGLPLSVPRYIDIIYDIVMIVFLSMFATPFAIVSYAVHMVTQSFLIEYTRKVFFNLTANRNAGENDEDEDRNELIRLGVINSRHDED